MGWTLQNDVKTVSLLIDVPITEIHTYTGNQLTSKYERQYATQPLQMVSIITAYDPTSIGTVSGNSVLVTSERCYKLLRRAGRER